MSQDETRSLYTEEFFHAWEKMVGSVENALSYQGGVGDQGRPVALQQARYVLTSLAIAQMFKDLQQQELAAHFHILAEAIQDLVDGVPHPLFKPERPPRRGRQNNTSDVWRIQSDVCVGVRFMLAGGVEESAAINHAVKKHKESLKRLLRPGAELRSSIASWLKKFQTEDVSNDVALAAFKRGVSYIPEAADKFSGERLRLAGEQLIASAAMKASTLPR